jgi:hypothetical protein
MAKEHSKWGNGVCGGDGGGGGGGSSSSSSRVGVVVLRMCSRIYYTPFHLI